VKTTRDAFYLEGNNIHRRGAEDAEKALFLNRRERRRFKKKLVLRVALE
jgi:hypothetical protein